MDFKQYIIYSIISVAVAEAIKSAVHDEHHNRNKIEGSQTGGEIETVTTSGGFYTALRPGGERETVTTSGGFYTTLRPGGERETVTTSGGCYTTLRPDTKTTIIALSVGLVILVIAVIIIICVFKRKCRKKCQEPTDV
ncbi:uncharacterized protein LOC115225335 isoform X1 [Octopus sinensis]|uniref:Uncharacterized protein LOC115225335 isoform X1 n=1 Tax=Octopus sinensis TaxID=2607531 RepID=A0A6P7TQF5_9MOLL|nr:uncharacterized protein LOC115225335 isoform X1 [Octopus sinensis]